MKDFEKIEELRGLTLVLLIAIVVAFFCYIGLKIL